MVSYVKLKDGGSPEEGLTDEQIAALEAQEGGLTDEQLAALENPRKPIDPNAPTVVDDFKRGVRGFVQGLKDPVMAVGQMASPEGSEADEILRAQLKEYEAGREGQGFDWGRLAGNIVNPVNLLPLSWLPKARTVGAAMKQGSALGGGMGLLTPTTTEEGFWGEKAQQGGLGLAAGMAVPAAAGAVSRVIAPELAPHVAKLRSEGVHLTPGQMLGGWQKSVEDRLTSLPIVGDFINSARKEGVESLNQAAYNRALSPINESATAKTGAEAMQQVHQKLSNAYDDVTKRMSLSANPAPANALPAHAGQMPAPTYIDDLTSLRQNMTSIPDKYTAYYDDVMRNMQAMATPQGNMSGESLNEATKLLLAKEKDLNAAAAGDPWWGKVREALKESRATLLRHAEQQNPQAAKDFAKVREGWANYSIIRNAAAGATDQVFSPSQLTTAVRQNEISQAGRAAGKGRLAENRARMQDLSNASSSVLPSSVPDTGNVGRFLTDAAVLGGGAAVAPEALIPIGMLSAPYLPGVRRATEALIGGGQNWRRPLAGGLTRMSPAFSAGAGASTSRD